MSYEEYVAGYAAFNQCEQLTGLESEDFIAGYTDASINHLIP